MSISNTTPTVEDLGPLRPIYGPSDPRYGELEQWFVDNAERLLDEDGNPKCEITDLGPTECAQWWEGRVLGIDGRTAAHRSVSDVVFPDFPDDVMPAPSWATSHDDGDTDAETERPVRVWHRELVQGDWPAAIVMESVWDPETGVVSSSSPRLSAWITGNDPLEVTEPEKAREVARLLLKLADEFEAAVS